MKTTLQRIGMILFMTGFFFSVWAQEMEVSGTVYDAQGKSPLIGVTVMVKGTQKGTVTDINGRYRIKAEKGNTLTFSYIGYLIQEIKVKKLQLDVYLKQDEATLDEVVVVAFGTQKNESIVGSASTVKDPAPVFGEAEFRHYFEKNYDKTVCPDEPISIKVEFYVNGQGRPGSIAIKENSCQKLETEIKRLLLGSPPWSERNRKVTLNWTLNE